MDGQNATSRQDAGRDETLHGSRSLGLPTYMVWGADTDVGKTLVSAALAAAAARAQVHKMGLLWSIYCGNVATTSDMKRSLGFCMKLNVRKPCRGSKWAGSTVSTLRSICKT